MERTRDNTRDPIQEKRRRRMRRVGLGLVLTGIGVLSIGNLIWCFTMSSGLGDVFYEWRCLDSGAILTWRPSRQMGLLNVQHIYWSSSHRWQRTYPRASYPFSWLYLATHADPDPTTVLSQSFLVNSPPGALIAAYLLEPTAVSENAGALIRSDVLPNGKLWTARTAGEIIGDLGVDDQGRALGRIGRLLEAEIESVGDLDAFLEKAAHEASSSGPATGTGK